jgi:hypothetical protein
MAPGKSKGIFERPCYEPFGDRGGEGVERRWKMSRLISPPCLVF